MSGIQDRLGEMREMKDDLDRAVVLRGVWDGNENKHFSTYSQDTRWLVAVETNKRVHIKRMDEPVVYGV